MKKIKKTVPLLLVAFLVIGGFQTSGWTQSYSDPQRKDPESDLYNVFDLIIARPAAALAGIAGVGIVILSLPFTIPTKSVDKAADIFVAEPFKFAFKRDFPDEDIL